MYYINPAYNGFPEVEGLMERIEEVFSTEGEMIFSGRRNRVKAFCLKEGDPLLQRVVVKEFRPRNVVQRVAYSLFVATKAERAFRNGMRLTEAGCDTPQPIAFATVRRGMTMRRCYYATAFTEAKSVRPLLEREDFSRPLARAFALFMARMHENGIVHHDMNFSNVLYEKEGNGDYRISVIDINRATLHEPQRLTVEKCKDDYVRWTDDRELFRYVMEVYAEARGLDRGEFLAKATEMKRRHDKAWKRRKGFTAKLKKL